MEKIIIPNNVQGDITSCEVKTTQKSLYKNSVFSLTQEREYITYDVCSKEIMDTYRIPEFTPFSHLLLSYSPFLIILILFVFHKIKK